MTPDDLLQRIRTRVTHPATVNELMRLLGLPRSEAPAIRKALKTLVARGALIETRGRHFGVPELMDLAAGRLVVNPNGFGFVKLDQPIDEVTGDIYVAGHNLHDAMHGDRVVVRVERHARDGRAEGRIVRILERSAATTVGRFDREDHGLQYVTPFDKRLLMDVQIPAGDDLGATAGQMVVIEIVRWPVHGRGALGRVLEVLGDINAPGVDTQIIIRKHGIPDRHSDESLAEASRMGEDVDPADIAGRTDFRGDVAVTIDGETARDFDDAVSVERLESGHYLLKVHIADVAHYVREGSALDREAADRGTSVYFPERAVHMFPEALATGLCSLRPHVDRLVQSCVMEIDGRGRVVDATLHDGVIVSRARMTYTDVHAILAGDAERRDARVEEDARGGDVAVGHDARGPDLQDGVTGRLEPEDVRAAARQVEAPRVRARPRRISRGERRRREALERRRRARRAQAERDGADDQRQDPRRGGADERGAAGHRASPGHCSARSFLTRNV